MILVIHTADSEKVFLGLVDKDGFVAQKTFKAQHKQAEKLLPEVDKLTKGNLKKLTGIAVVAGPGSFTALRIGVTTANALSWALKILIIDIIMDDIINPSQILQKMKKGKKDLIITPAYGQEPNITKKK